MKNTYEIFIDNDTYDAERAFYGLMRAAVNNCTFAGPADGESVLKECREIRVENCNFSLRYPLWHVEKFDLINSGMDEKTRAALWYCKNGNISGCNLSGIKALRECKSVILNNCNIVSPEFGWRCKNIKLHDIKAVSEYFMFESKNLVLDGVDFTGKYSFQYTKDVKINDCDFTTKDAFWHSKNVTVKNTLLKGEYLGWYSDGLTLINCTISGTQPLCYCKNLRLINCRMENCDLSFEYSDVNADIIGNVLSVKNPKSGKITADGVGEIIFAENNIPCKGKVVIR